MKATKISQTLTKVDPLLRQWFSEGYHRKSSVDIAKEVSRGFTEEEVRFAGSIFKRGFIELRDDEDSPKTGSTLIPPLNMQTNKELKKNLKSLSQENAFFIVDEMFLKVQPFHESCIPGDRCYRYEASESTKTIETVKCILEKISDETDVIVAIGGGITTDIAGFVAGLLQVKVHYVATTLLSAVDASVGGKCGVNFFPFGKNQLGLFYEVSSLTVVPEHFSTLCDKELCAGLSEALKHTWLSGDFEDRIQSFRNILQAKTALDVIHEIGQLVINSYETKVSVVLKDPYELHFRGLLNFGHTLAHVWEALSEEGYLQKIPHGVAVAYGMRKLLPYLEGTPQGFESVLTQTIEHSTVSISTIKACKSQLADRVQKLISSDKKNDTSGKIKMVLPKYGILKEQSVQQDRMFFQKDIEFAQNLVIDEIQSH